jgi:hypothetical protein
MFSVPDNMSVAMLRDIEKANPNFPQYAHRVTCRSYDQFLETLYKEIYTIVREMEQDANHMQERGENDLNADICRQLRRLGYDAINDKNSRGHADISVLYAGYTWIGEGKIVHSVDNSYLKKGYDQILERYITGKAGENQAALLIYVFAPSAKHVMAKWQEYLKTCDAAEPGYAENFSACLVQPDHVFFCERNAHTSSGSKITIRHIAFSLHWSPSK